MKRVLFFLLLLSSMEGYCVVIHGNTNPVQGATETYYVDPIPGANTYQWTIPNTWSGSSSTNSITVVIGTAGTTNEYHIKVRPIGGCNNNGAEQDLEIHLCVPFEWAPLITLNPTTGILGLTTTYDTYQWCLGTIPVPGATNPTYFITYDGEYSVIVTQCGVSDSTFFCAGEHAQPYPITYNSGTHILTAPNTYRSYKWFKNGVEISGETNNWCPVTCRGTYRVESVEKCNATDFYTTSHAFDVTDSSLPLCSP